MLIGFHFPNIITARAKNPNPATPLSNDHVELAEAINAIPPSPPKAPEIITPI